VTLHLFQNEDFGVYEGVMELLLFLQRAGLESRCCSAVGHVARERGWSWFPPRAALRGASFSLCDVCILEKHLDTRFHLFFSFYYIVSRWIALLAASGRDITTSICYVCVMIDAFGTRPHNACSQPAYKKTLALAKSFLSRQRNSGRAKILREIFRAV
jgi:hypothetical protein